MDPSDAMRQPTHTGGSASKGGPSATPASLPTVPDYELLRSIGKGGFGEVWLARSTATGVLRAAKIVWRHTFEEERPFQREFEGIQRFERISREHPSQLALFHIGRNEAEGYFYYVMELADDANGATMDRAVRNAESNLESYTAHTLRYDLRKGRLPADRVLEIGLALGEALRHLHGCGLVHRDVKPSNVIFVNGRSKLADIGLVTDASKTVTASPFFTDGYVPPGELGTPQADIFALGKVLYEAATGFDRLDFPKLPEDLRSWPDAKQVFEINAIVLKACAKDPGARYESAESMLKDLEHLQQGKSIKRKHALQGYWAIGRKAAAGLAGLAVMVAIVNVLLRGRQPVDLEPDGPLSTNPIAVADCDKGMAIIRNDNFAQLAQAYAYFTNAIALDTNNVRPYVGLLEMAVRDAGTFWTSKESQAMRRQVAERLEKLSPDLGATYTAKAVNAFYDWDFRAAEQYAKQAVKASPEYEFGHTWYSYMLSHWDRPREARAQLEFSKKLARSKAIVSLCLGHTYYAERKFEEARDHYKQAVKISGRQQPPFTWLGRAQRALGDYPSSIETMKTGDLLVTKDPDATARKFASWHNALETGGTNGYWMEFSKLFANKTNDFYGRAIAQVHLGERDKALEFLRQAVARKEGRGGDSGVIYLLFDESWDVFRNDDGFKALLEETSFKAVMPARRQ